MAIFLAAKVKHRFLTARSPSTRFLSGAFLFFCTSLFSFTPLASPPRGTEFKLVATVKDVVSLSRFSGTVKPVDVDPNFVVTMQIESMTPSLDDFDEGGTVAFAIHSVVILFGDEPDKAKSYNFTVHREEKDGRVRFFDLQVQH